MYISMGYYMAKQPQFKTMAELQAFVAEQTKAIKDQEYAELDSIINDVKEMLQNTKYSLKDLYFRDRSKDGSAATKKAGTYKVGGKEIKWSGLGKRPAELSGKSNEELKALKLNVKVG